MYRKFLGRLAVGAALASAALFVVTPGIAAADVSRSDSQIKGDIYVFPRFVQPGHDIKIVEFCKEPQRYPTIWSKITGTLPLKRAHLFDQNGGNEPAPRPAPQADDTDLPRSAPGGSRADEDGVKDDAKNGAKNGAKDGAKGAPEAEGLANGGNGINHQLFTYWTEAEVPWYTRPGWYFIKGVCGYSPVYVKGGMVRPPAPESLTKDAVYQKAPKDAVVEESAQLSDPLAEMAAPGALMPPGDLVDAEMQPDLVSAPRGAVSAGDGGVGAAHTDLAASGVGALGLAGFGRLALRRRRRTHGHI